MSPDQASAPSPAQQGSWSVTPELIVEVAELSAAEVPGVVEVTRAGAVKAARPGGSSFNLKAGLVRLLNWRRPAVGSGPMHVSISIVAEYGRALPDLAETVRERAARAIESTTGYQVSAVDVTIADLHAPGDPLPPRTPASPGLPSADGGRLDF